MTEGNARSRKEEQRVQRLGQLLLPLRQLLALRGGRK